MGHPAGGRAPGREVERVPDDLLWSMFCSYLFTIAVETPVLLLGLSRPHPWHRRLIAGIWLTACTYPFLWLVLPAFLSPEANRPLYLAVGETFVPVCECALFWAAMQRGRGMRRADLIRDWVVIVVANLASFLLGEVANRLFP